MTTDPVLTAHGPADLLSAMPYLLGFHPADSVVIAVIDQSTVACVARIDLADARVPGRPGMLLGPFLRQVGLSSRVAVVGYGDDPVQVPEVVRRVAAEVAVPTFIQLVVCDGVWWHVERPDEVEP